MRTNERTFKQHLAFDDKDRHSDLHNDACLYLAQEEKARKFLTLVPRKVLARMFSAFIYEGPQRDTLEIRETHDLESLKVESVGAGISQPIAEPRGAVAGFADLIVNLNLSTECTKRSYERERLPSTFTAARLTALRAKVKDGESADQPAPQEPSSDYTEWVMVKEEKSPSKKSIHLIVEVKHGVTHVANAIQQLEMYQKFIPINTDPYRGQVIQYVLATLYHISQTEKETLARHGISHIYVSPEHVMAFVAAQTKSEDLAF